MKNVIKAGLVVLIIALGSSCAKRDQEITAKNNEGEIITIKGFRDYDLPHARYTPIIDYGDSNTQNLVYWSNVIVVRNAIKIIDGLYEVRVCSWNKEENKVYGCVGKAFCTTKLQIGDRVFLHRVSEDDAYNGSCPTTVCIAEKIP